MRLLCNELIYFLSRYKKLILNSRWSSLLWSHVFALDFLMHFYQKSKNFCFFPYIYFWSIVAFNWKEVFILIMCIKNFLALYRKNCRWVQFGILWNDSALSALVASFRVFVFVWKSVKNKFTLCRVFLPYRICKFIFCASVAEKSTKLIINYINLIVVTLFLYKNVIIVNVNVINVLTNMQTTTKISYYSMRCFYIKFSPLYYWFFPDWSWTFWSVMMAPGLFQRPKSPASVSHKIQVIKSFDAYF